MTNSNTEDAVSKCVVSDDPKEVVLCERLNDYVEAPNPKGKGLKEYILTNFKTGEKRWACIAYHSSAKDRGVALNFCPWCGESLRPPAERK